MAVLRVVPNISVADPEAARNFYAGLLALDPVMDHGWLVTLAGKGQARPQLSVASQGGSGTRVPDLSIEVDDLEAVLDRARAQGLEIFYGPTDEPWGVRRFYVRDPFGTVLNILTHIG
jgi:catechol 2,3-dioxygenase-like lactoylglutathione lyase family enzyme